MSINLEDYMTDEPLQEEREVGQYLAEMIISLCNQKQFEHAEETTLDFYHDQYDYESDEPESGSDYDIENDKNKNW